MKIEIEWLSDEIDCDTCGGNYAQGARIEFEDGHTIILEPSAHCWDEDHWGTKDVYKKILQHLGHEVVDK